jgi:hypothetical protein
MTFATTVIDPEIVTELHADLHLIAHIEGWILNAADPQL